MYSAGDGEGTAAGAGAGAPRWRGLPAVPPAGGRRGLCRADGAEPAVHRKAPAELGGCAEMGCGTAGRPAL